MKIRPFVSTSLGLVALLFVTSPLAQAAGFDLTGTTISSTLQVGAQTFTTGIPTPVVVGTDYPTELGAQFVSANLGIIFDVHDDTSTYIAPGSDGQGIFYIFYNSGDPEGPSYTLQAGVSFVITFNFASAEAQTITDFEFIQGSSNLIAGFTGQFNAATSTLTLLSTQDIELSQVFNHIEGRFVASPIPEPATASIFAGFAAIAALAGLRRSRNFVRR
ncbi:hypothetical protein [Rariglobus hedericola]|uniref:PEP-CTERM sorting domain-containing protein n=1 Tax=Rariglobus hedericola TaxID=2597822 RepID=A0A556QK67_9BACT|nr:hypothetical protein [Rariglobus hedericola]TSJ77018.1 hypothetical protein FPL22_12980 [Rariglobus hedericola]